LRVTRALLTIAALCLAIVSCGREVREFRAPAGGWRPAAGASYSSLRPGPRVGMDSLPQTPMAEGSAGREVEKNAYALSEGKRLFSAMNCVGCHSHGGGGMGPALMDSVWFYGHEPRQIFASIVEGRPNGMPSFRGRIAEYQVWQLVAYVRSLAGLVPSSAATNRDDDLWHRPPEASTPPQSPHDKPPGAPPATVKP
jgi:cytochrome c oxidase cbb3-type subunit 3